MAECLLFFAARQMHTEKLIKPALDEGKVVICDRYTDSTVAYQGYGHGFDRTTIYQIEKLTLGDFRPDLTLLLDLPVEEGLTRSLKQKDAAGGRENTEDRFEKLKTEFHERLRRGFLTIAKENSGRCVVVDAVQDVDHVFSQVRAQSLHGWRLSMLFDDMSENDEELFSMPPVVEAQESMPAENLSARQTPFLWGHGAIEQNLITMLQNKRFPHGLIFSGGEGVGKSVMAYRLARYLFAKGNRDDDGEGSLALYRKNLIHPFISSSNSLCSRGWRAGASGFADHWPRG